MVQLIKVRRHPRDRCRGILQAGPLSLPCVLGRGSTSIFKREGDGATPAHAPLKILWGYWRTRRGGKPESGLSFIPSRKDEGWCDAPSHGAYNDVVRLPFAASHETLQREDRLYDLCIVLSWNMAGHGRLRNKGSAIFMHVARPANSPTEGCIALQPRDLRRLLKVIGPQTRIVVER